MTWKLVRWGSKARPILLLTTVAAHGEGGSSVMSGELMVASTSKRMEYSGSFALGSRPCGCSSYLSTCSMS